MVNEFRSMLEKHSEVFRDCDEMFFYIPWLDIPEYCEIMKDFAGTEANRERIRTAFDLWYLVEGFPEEVSDDLREKVEETIKELLIPVGDIANRLLTECRKAETNQ